MMKIAMSASGPVVKTKRCTVVVTQITFNHGVTSSNPIGLAKINRRGNIRQPESAYDYGGLG